MQADVFAAEFLCPSARLRALLAKGITAGEVATRLGIDVTLVLHQAAQALLLPPREAERKRRLVPDEAQLACATAPSPVLALGGPGSGKTTALLARVARMLDVGLPPASMLVLVRSEEAAAAARATLAASHPKSVGEAWIGTFAGLAFEIITKWPEAIGRTDAMRVLDPEGTAELVRGVLADLGSSEARGGQRPEAGAPTPREVTRASVRGAPRWRRRRTTQAGRDGLRSRPRKGGRRHSG